MHFWKLKSDRPMPLDVIPIRISTKYNEFFVLCYYFSLGFDRYFGRQLHKTKMKNWNFFLYVVVQIKKDFIKVFADLGVNDGTHDLES